jgi:O-6-methylguanine DNA methyltransferase
MIVRHHAPLLSRRVLHVVMRTQLGDVSIVGYDGGISRIEFIAPLGALRRGKSAEMADIEARNDTTERSNSLSFTQTNTELNDKIAARPREIDELLKGTVAAINGDPIADAVPLRIEGTPFQRAVWDFLRTIPVGSRRTYAEIARAIHAPRAHRAVANACGANHIAILIPCHRAVRSDGSSGGYRWGRERKRVLLEREAISKPSDASVGFPADSTEGQR